MIQVTALHARYPGKTSGEALRGFNLEVRLGRIYALLGPNGAGKTTLLRCLTGLLHPASGSLQMLGTEIAGGVAPGLLKRMGVLIESPSAYARMTAMEYLRFFAGFYSGANPAVRIEELAAAFELPSLSVRVGKLSQGNRRKVQLMRSLVHEPDLVLWDEPTEHLDPRAQRLVLAHLRNYMATGASALITSHRLEQMQDMADDFGFLRHGVLVHSLSREDLSASLDEVEIEGAGDLEAPMVEALAIRLDLCNRLAPEKLRLGQWGLHLRGRNMLGTLPDVIKALMESGGRILRVEPRHRSLESLYRHHVEDAP